jgi:hypothetical protein
VRNENKHIKGTVQRDGSGPNYAHSIDLYKRKRRGGFLEKSPRPPSSESPLTQGRHPVQ